MSVYEGGGGSATFKLLVERFYARVASDPVLRPIYPEEDLSSATERLTLFLIQYWGGPTTYSARRGHPRLRLRHQPFAIGPAERDAWLEHMTAAVAALDPPPACLRTRLAACEATSLEASLATDLKSPVRPVGLALGSSSSRLRPSSSARRRVTSRSRDRASIARSATSSAAAPKIAGIPASSKCRL